MITTLSKKRMVELLSEADIYELLAEPFDTQNGQLYLLVRGCKDRVVNHPQFHKMLEVVRSQPVIQVRQIDVSKRTQGIGICKNKRTLSHDARTASVSVHAASVMIASLRVPFTLKRTEQVSTWVSLLIRPLVRPRVPGYCQEQTMEIRFFAPGGLVSNLDFVESIFRNAGDPLLPDNDAALEVEHHCGVCLLLWLTGRVSPHGLHSMAKSPKLISKKCTSKPNTG